MMPTPMPMPSDSPARSATEPPQGGRLVATGGRELPLEAVSVRADAGGGRARTVLEQRFANPHDEPLRVTYQVPLPADGAVSGYAFRIGERRVTGVVDRRAAARERFEEAILDGRTAGLLEQDRASLFSLELGNVPPGAEVVAELTIDHPLAWLDEGAWEWRFPTVVAPRYLGRAGRVADAGRVVVDVADRPLDIPCTLALTVRDELTRAPESPSHALEVTEAGSGARTASFSGGAARLDRDVVVRWGVARPEVGAHVATARPAAGAAGADSGYGLITLVPPDMDHRGEPVARDLILLLDTSGSMNGEPLALAVRVASALVDTLRDRDRLEMFAFSSHVERWSRRPRRMDPRRREQALAWLASRRAGGSTEMHDAILAALAPIRPDSQRQVVLVTDGLIGFEEEIVAEILDRLPRGARVHTVGVGSAINRTLTKGAARAGHGEEVIIGIGEDPERAAARLVARTSAPLVVDLELDGDAVIDCAPERLPDLFSGAPALLSVRLRAEGGTVRARGRTPFGRWEHRLEVPAMQPGRGDAAVIALWGRERVEDLEARRAGGGDATTIDADIERIGLDFQLATRLTSWVAIDEAVAVDPGKPGRRVHMPHALPAGMSVEGLGLRHALPAAPGMVVMAYAAPMALQAATAGAPPSPPRAAPAAAPMRKSFDRSARGRAPTGAPIRSEEAAGPDDARRFDRAMDVDEEAVPMLEPEIAPPGAPEREAGRPLRNLRGRLLLHTADRMVVEIAIDHPALSWDPPATVDLLLADRVATVPLDPDRSTRAGDIASGRTLRIVLDLASAGFGAEDTPTTLTLDCAGLSLYITL